MVHLQDATYMGHKNYNHHNVATWIEANEFLHKLAKDCLKSCETMEGAAHRMLAEMETMGIAKTPDGIEYNYTNVRAALKGLK